MGIEAESIQKAIKDTITKLHHIENTLVKLIIRAYNRKDRNLSVTTKIPTQGDSFFGIVFIADP